MVDVRDASAALRVFRMMAEKKRKLLPPSALTIDDWRQSSGPDYDMVYVWRQWMLERFEVDPAFAAAARAYYAKPENCVKFIVHWCDTYDPRNVGTSKPTWMPFILFTRQVQLVEFVLDCLWKEQPGLVEKCRTMGATWICVAISIWLWLFYPGVGIGWGSQKADSVDVLGDPDSIFEKIRLMISRLPDVFKPPGLRDEHLKQMTCTNPDNGSVISGQVGDNIGRGGRKRIFFLDEAAHYAHPELIEAAISENTKVPIYISSVNGIGNLFYRKREAGIDWYPGAEIEPGFTRVFVMDSHEHPEFTEEWHRVKYAKHVREGTVHIYAQEIARDYAASVQGTIIDKQWLDACIDAHIKLGLPDGGPRIAGLDIGDSEDGDRNALSIRESSKLISTQEWVARDPGVTARRAIGICVDNDIPELQYDAVGLGSNVKSEVNRLKDDDAFPKGLRVVPWNAGGKVLHPAERVVPDDRQSAKNKDFFFNLKAQAWWHLRTIIYNTYSAIEANGRYDAETGMVMCPSGATYDPTELFILPSDLPLLHKVTKELCQPTASKGSKLKLVIDKAPEGTRSPNIADSIVMAYWPMPDTVGQFVGVGLMPSIGVGGVVVGNAGLLK